jgi:ABC-type nickel/cobalt efflux system permease component RcnA
VSADLAAPRFLLGATVSTAVFHTLIPDHWLPFVLIGLARGWSGAKAAVWSGLSAVIHVGFSLCLGVGGLAVGQGTAMLAGRALEEVSGWLLIAFGLGYAWYARRKGGHFHIGGERVHRRSAHGTGDAHDEHDHAAAESGGVDEDLIQSEPRGRGPLYLAVIIGLNPCVLVVPLLLKSVEYGRMAVVVTAVSYSVSVIVLMVGLTLFGVAGGKRLEMPFLRRHGEVASGLLIAMVGVVFMFLER